MDSWSRRHFLRTALVAAGGSFLIPKNLWAELAPGVETKALPLVTGEERQRQSNLWVMEVNYKPLRLIWVDLPDRKTGKTRPTVVWYLCYRAVNRPIPRPEAENVLPPVPEPQEPPLFVPEFTLVTDDNQGQKIYIDRVIPVAQEAIIKRERQQCKNSVEIVGPVPPPTPYGSKDEQELYGVATWRGVDPTTDRFKIFMTGFSNGYVEQEGPDGRPVILRRTLVQEYWRPGDEYDPAETEIRQVGEPKWVYR